MHTRFSTRAHQRVAYDVAGPADAPAAVLLHDLLGQRSSMSPLRDRLSEHARCVSVDLRGHGASATISGASIDLRKLALDIVGVLEQEQILSAVLVGHGLGAAISRMLAADHPSLVAGVVTVETAGVGPDGALLAETDRRAADLAYKGLVDAALAAYLDPRLGSTWRDDLPRPAVAALRRHTPALATLLPALAEGVTAGDALTVLVETEPGRLDLSPATVDAAIDAVRSLLAPRRT